MNTRSIAAALATPLQDGPRWAFHRYTLPCDVPVTPGLEPVPFVPSGPTLVVDRWQGLARLWAAPAPAHVRRCANAPTAEGGWTADRYTAPVLAGER